MKHGNGCGWWGALLVVVLVGAGCGSDSEPEPEVIADGSRQEGNAGSGREGSPPTTQAGRPDGDGSAAGSANEEKGRGSGKAAPALPVLGGSLAVDGKPLPNIDVFLVQNSHLVWRFDKFSPHVPLGEKLVSMTAKFKTFHDIGGTTKKDMHTLRMMDELDESVVRYEKDRNVILSRVTIQRTRTDASGRFQFAVAPGHYWIYAEARIGKRWFIWLRQEEQKAGTGAATSLTEANPTYGVITHYRPWPRD